MPYCVKWCVQGDADDPETGATATAMVRDRDFRGTALTLAVIRELFPFEGKFHFRLRVGDPAGRAGYVWLDLTRDSEDVLAIAQNLGGIERLDSAEALNIKALPLSFEPVDPAASADEASQDFSAWTEEDLTFGRVDPSPYQSGGGGGVRESPRAGTSSGGGGGGGGGGVSQSPRYGDGGRQGSGDFGMGHQRQGSGGYGGDRFDQDGGEGNWRGALESTLSSAQQGVKSVMESDTAKELKKKSAQAARSMGLGAKKLWNNLSKGGKAALPTMEALENLHTLSAMLETNLDTKRPEHLALLTRLWDFFFQGAPFEAVSQRWREVGFQNANVAADVRNTGTLSLRAMRYMCDKYPAASRQMMEQQSAKTAATYPFAVVGNNLTLMLADVLELRAQQFASTRAPYWAVFDDETGFFEVFCMAFRLLDHTWKEQNATRERFGKIIGHTKSCLESLLDSGPPSLQAFMDQATAAGLLY